MIWYVGDGLQVNFCLCCNSFGPVLATCLPLKAQERIKDDVLVWVARSKQKLNIKLVKQPVLIYLSFSDPKFYIPRHSADSHMATDTAVPVSIERGVGSSGPPAPITHGVGGFAHKCSVGGYADSSRDTYGL